MKKKILDILPERGVYTLIIFLSKKTKIEVGKLGKIELPNGYYAYTGSALGPYMRALQNRVYRHLSKEKTVRWHIDYLLANPNAVVTAVVAAETEKRLECKINKLIAKNLNGKIIMEGFGASDCKENCKSHLIFLNKRKDLEFEISKIYEKCFEGRFSTIIFA